MRRAESRPRRLLERLLADGLVVAALALWWLTARGLPAFVLPSPPEVGEALLRLFTLRDFAAHTLASTLRVVLSVVLAVGIGFALAVAADRSAALSAILQRRLLPLLNSFPAIAWAILAAIWLPPGDLGVILVEVLILLPFCLVNLTEGLRALDRETLEMARSFTHSRLLLVRKVLLPLLFPYLVAAIRISYGVAWKVALVAELFGADRGLGYLMLRAQVSSDSATVFATCFAIVIIFVAGEKLVIDPLARLVPAE